MKTRINLFFVSSFIVTLAVLCSTMMFLAQIHADALKLAANEQEQAIRTFWQLLQAKGTDFRVVNGRMLVGNYEVKEDCELPERIKEIFGGTATIFVGDRWAATNLFKGDGSRAVGTRLTGPAYDAIFREHRSYRGEAPILGIPYFTAYDPIHDASGNIIGALYVGIKKSEFLIGYARMRARIIAGTSLLEILLLALAWKMLRRRLQEEARLQEVARILSETTGNSYFASLVENLSRLLQAEFAFIGELTGEQRDSIRVIAAFGRGKPVEPFCYRLAGTPCAEVVSGGLRFYPDGVARRYPHNRLLDEMNAEGFLGMPLKLANGRVVGVLVVLDSKPLRTHHDTEPIFRLFAVRAAAELDRLRNEVKQREMAERVRLVTDSVPVNIAYVDKELRYQFVNRGYEEWFELPREEIIGRSIESMRSPAEFARIRSHVEKALAGERTTFVTETAKKNGSNAFLLANYVPHQVEDRVIGFFVLVSDITEQKKTEKMLAEREEFLSNILDSIQDGISIIDETLQIVTVNPVIARRFSHCGPLAGRKCHEMYHGRSEPCEFCPSLETLRSGEPAMKTFPLKADGREIWLELHTFPLFDSQKTRVVGVIEYTRDVTERKWAEDALIAAEEKFRSLVEQSLVGAYIIQDGNFVYVNPKMAEIFGYTREELTAGMSHLELTSMQDRPLAAENVRRRTSGEVPSVQYEFQGLRKDGTKNHIEVYGTSIEYNGKAAIIGTLLDVTARSIAQEALRESEERFHQLFAQSDDAIILIRLDNFTIIDANPAAQELFRYDHAAFVSLLPATLIGQKGFAALIDAIPQNDSADVFQFDRAEGIQSDGSRVTIAIRGKILRLREEYIIHCSIRDITEKMQLEEDVRTAQAKLIHANKMTSIGMLASSVAHEINNPNNCISVNAAMLADVWKDAEPLLKTIHKEQGEFMLRGIPFTKMQDFAPRLLDGIREGSRRITAIVQNMRDYVREDKSGLQGKIDINQLLQNAIAILWHHIHIHTDSFATHLGEGLPLARGNGQQVEQVLINLVTNALQALPEKKSGVSVTTAMADGEIIITVRDEGVGMDEATLARLTEPFFTTRTDDGGTGLGLYISASIIKEHGGTLEFQSAPGMGTTAICRLPMAGGGQQLTR